MKPVRGLKIAGLVGLVALMALVTQAEQVEQVATKVTKANASRLSFDDRGLAYLNIKTKRKKADGSGWEDNVRKVLFTGVAFWDEPWGRAEVTYSNGILHGQVTVVSRNRLLYQFRYQDGVKVTNSETSVTSSTNVTSPISPTSEEREADSEGR